MYVPFGVVPVLATVSVEVPVLEERGTLDADSEAVRPAGDTIVVSVRLFVRPPMLLKVMTEVAEDEPVGMVREVWLALMLKSARKS